MPLLDAIGAYLEAQGLGTVKTTANSPATWPIYKAGLVPGYHADMIALAQGPGSAPIDQMGSSVGVVPVENPSLVVQVRHADYEAAMVRATAIWAKLHKYSGSLSGVTYLLIQAQQQPFPIGRDGEQRWVIGCNYSVAKAQG